jgi:hypothetical protein
MLNTPLIQDPIFRGEVSAIKWKSWPSRTDWA